jgi:aminoglycoside phosphotransferase (APT) family kinase protein
MLDLAEIPTYLMDRKLLSARAVVDGGLRIVDCSRLNRVFVVTAQRERCLVVKLPGEPGHTGVAHEALVLERLRATDPGRGLSRHLPTPVSYDPTTGVLVLEAAPHAQDLERLHARGRFAKALAREAGRGLAVLHSVPGAFVADLDGPDNVRRLRPHRLDLSAVHTLTPASLELIRMIQGVEELCSSLDELAASFRRDSVIHGDVRWNNCLAWRNSDGGRWTRLHLIDWELCGAGDPALDVGAFFGEYLRAWLQSIPIADPRDPGRLIAHAGLPLRRMRPALRAFWDAYTEHSTETATVLSRRLRRAIPFAAVRLLMAALEEAQVLDELSARVLYLLPLSQNILRRPEEASEHLLGLGVSRAAA